MTKIGVEQKHMIDAARLMVPKLLKRARKTESDGVIPMETLNELSEQGFFVFISLNVMAVGPGISVCWFGSVPNWVRGVALALGSLQILQRRIGSLE